MSFFSSSKSKYSTLKIAHPGSKKKDLPEGLWLKCKKCSRTLFKKQLEDNTNICPYCSHHEPLIASERIKSLTDTDSFVEMDAAMESVDGLNFVDSQPYSARLVSNMSKTGLKDAVICGTATLDGRKYALGVMDFRFMGASMGSVVGEKITRMIEKATELNIPAVMITASGGARMQEGILSLMQMPKTCAALERHAEAGLGYIVVLGHPTYGGVTASFATLGDILLAEPGAMIGFAGPRVIQETTNSKLPEGFQTSEFLLEKGLVDRVVDRKNLRKELSLCLEYFGG